MCLTFHTAGPALSGKEVFELLNNARNLTKELFGQLGPTSAKELFTYYVDRLFHWRCELEAYKSKTNMGNLPGRKTIENSLREVERLLCLDDSFDFFKTVASQQDTLLKYQPTG